MKLYELHKVDENIGNHLPILVGTEDDMRPALTNETGVESAFKIGELHGARPIERFADGRIQIGHYMYVPVPEGQGTSGEVDCPACDWRGHPTQSGRYPKHGGDGNPSRRCTASGKKINKGSGGR